VPDKLYYLRCNDKPLMGTVATISESLPLQYHFRLDHASLKAKKQVVSYTISKLECASCELGKHFRSTMSRKNNHCGFPFEVVHTDIWELTGLKLFQAIHIV